MKIKLFPESVAMERIARFEGGAVYVVEDGDRHLVIVDEASVLDLLDPDDRNGLSPRTVLKFASPTARREYLISQGWLQANE